MENILSLLCIRIYPSNQHIYFFNIFLLPVCFLLNQEKVPSEVLRRYATSELPGSDLLFPAVSQAEKAMINIYQFSRGGKQLTEPERKSIKELVISASFGPAERVKAKLQFKIMIKRNIEGIIASRELGDAEKYLQGEYERVRGILEPSKTPGRKFPAQEQERRVSLKDTQGKSKIAIYRGKKLMRWE